MEHGIQFFKFDAAVNDEETLKTEKQQVDVLPADVTDLSDATQVRISIGANLLISHILHNINKYSLKF